MIEPNWDDWAAVGDAITYTEQGIPDVPPPTGGKWLREIVCERLQDLRRRLAPPYTSTHRFTAVCTATGDGDNIFEGLVVQVVQENAPTKAGYDCTWRAPAADVAARLAAPAAAKSPNSDWKTACVAKELAALEDCYGITDGYVYLEASLKDGELVPLAPTHHPTTAG
jgi:hypothetical protein